MAEENNRLVGVVLTVTDLDRALQLYSAAFGPDLHVDDHHGDDVWTSGGHAATSWTEGAFVHFALYASNDGAVTNRTQIAFRVADLAAAHRRAVEAGAEVIHQPKPQPWDCRPGIGTSTAM